MFVLRGEHLAAFATAARETFEDRMIAHLHSRYPEESQAMGPEPLRARVRDGVARAERYGFRSERDLAAFIRLTFALGPDFDTGGPTGWAGPILADETTSPRQRIERLVATARERGIRPRRSAAGAAGPASAETTSPDEGD